MNIFVEKQLITTKHSLHSKWRMKATIFLFDEWIYYATMNYV